MKKLLAAVVSLTLVSACSEAPQGSTPRIVGQPAPAFTASAATGKPVSLADYRGKTVVLEWHNPGCPSVKKHYDSGNMQQTQVAAAKDGVVWLTINSGAPGNQGHMSGAEAQAFVAKAGARPAAYLLDPSGVVGKSYDAKTTPQIYVVNPAGTLVYAGGVDDKPTTDPADVKGARNHVLAALADLKAGKPVTVATSRPYGCSVKYSTS